MSEETIPQMRDRIDVLEKANQDLTTGNETLSKAKSGLLAREAFGSAGYEASHGDLFAAVNTEGDITKEVVNEFAGQHNLPKVEAGEPTTEGGDGSTEGGDGTSTEAPGSTALAGMQRGGSSSSDGTGGASPEKMTIAEWQTLMATDPVAGREAQRQGRVTVSADNPWLDGKPVAPGLNPYVVPTPEVTSSD